MLSLIFTERTVSQDNLIINPADFKNLFGQFLYTRDFNISDFITDNAETIKLRQEIFFDILNEPQVLQLIENVIPLLENINELYKSRELCHEAEEQLYSIKLIQLYIEFIETIYTRTQEFKERITSVSLSNFIQFIDETVKSDEFVNLVKNTSQLSREINEVKSITIGMNLDHTFTPREFGILSLNNELMTSNNFIERLTKKADDKKLCAISPLKITSKALSKEERIFADMAISSAITRLYKSTIKEWEPAVKAFFRQKCDIFLPLIKEFKFLSFGAKILGIMREKNLPLSLPEIKEKSDRSFSAKSIYNPIIALQRDKITYNDITFDDNGMIYLITGPNSGGKSVFTSAIGMCQVFAQLGFPVPAKRAEISPVEHIFVSIADKATSTNKGRLEEECVQIKHIFDTLSEYSLILMDETFSSTSSFEGAHIAFDVIHAFSVLGCKVIFSTHMHELISMIDEINTDVRCKSKADTLTIEIDDNGNHNYKIIRAIPNGKSYARNISKKYGLAFDTLMDKIKEY